MDKNSTGSLSNQQSGDDTHRDQGKQSGKRSGEEITHDQGTTSCDETPQNQGISNKLPNRSRITGGNASKSAWGNAMAKLQETACQLGMETARHDPTRRNLNFDDKEEDSIIKLQENSTLRQRPAKGTHRRTSNDPATTVAAANADDSTILNNNSSRPNQSNCITPQPMPHNPYSTGRKPLTDKDLSQANDFYLGERFGKDDGDELEALYDVLNLPKNWFGNVLYTFIRVIEEEEVPYLSDKEIKNLPRLVDLEPETLVDWYEDMESKLMMMTTVSLLPFDAIVINWQYVGLCIPGIGERRYLEMAQVLWRVCAETLPREEDAVRNAVKINSNRPR